MISEYTVAGLAAESKFGWELGNNWLESNKELVSFIVILDSIIVLGSKGKSNYGNVCLED